MEIGLTLGELRNRVNISLSSTKTYSEAKNPKIRVKVGINASIGEGMDVAMIIITT